MKQNCCAMCILHIIATRWCHWAVHMMHHQVIHLMGTLGYNSPTLTHNSILDMHFYIMLK